MRSTLRIVALIALDTDRDACDFVGNTLGPDYNAAPPDHFHFGMRGFSLCR